MIFWKTIYVADHERMLVYKKEQFLRLLLPGKHRVNNSGNDIRIEKYDVTAVIFTHAKERFLLAQYQDLLAEHLETFELTDVEVGLFYREGRLVDILSPGSSLTVWKGVENVRVEKVNIYESYIVNPSLAYALRKSSASALSMQGLRRLKDGVLYGEVPNNFVGMLYIDGKQVSVLPPGPYQFWIYQHAITVKLFDMRLQTLDVSGQEILTKDRVSLRINMVATYHINDPKQVVNRLEDYADFIYRELQLSLRETVGTQSLDELLVDKNALNRHLLESSKAKLDEYGITLNSVGIKDIVLPGDMKAILNQVVEAQKAAEANLVKRREETQAMRALHNTAKMMENNPVLLRLKELEALERVTERIDSISVYGGLDSVLNDLVRLAPNHQ